MHCEPNRRLASASSSGRRTAALFTGHLVGTGAEQLVHVGHGADPAADGKGDGERFSHPAHRGDRGPPLLPRGGDVEQAELIGLAGVVGERAFERVPLVGEVDEIHPIHHASVLHIETGDDAPGQHGRECTQAAAGRTDVIEGGRKMRTRGR